MEWAKKLGLKSFEIGGPFDKALDAVCERLGVRESYGDNLAVFHSTFTFIIPQLRYVNPERKLKSCDVRHNAYSACARPVSGVVIVTCRVFGIR